MSKFNRNNNQCKKLLMETRPRVKWSNSQKLMTSSKWKVSKSSSKSKKVRWTWVSSNQARWWCNKILKANTKKVKRKWLSSNRWSTRCKCRCKCNRWIWIQAKWQRSNFSRCNNSNCNRCKCSSRCRLIWAICLQSNNRPTNSSYTSNSNMR